MKIFNWQGGTRNVPVLITQQHINALIKAGADPTLTANVKGFVKPASGSIQAYEKYRLEMFPGLTVLADKVVESSFVIGCDQREMNEGQSVEFFVSGMEVSNLKFRISHQLEVTSGNIAESTIRGRVHINGHTLTVDPPRENASWTDYLTIEACPIYEDMDTTGTKQIMNMLVHAVGIESVNVSCGDEHGEVKGGVITPIRVSANGIGGNAHTKGDGIATYEFRVIDGGGSVYINQGTGEASYYNAEDSEVTLRYYVYLFGSNVYSFSDTLSFVVHVQSKKYAIGYWDENSLSADGQLFDGDEDFLQNWHPMLIDCTAVINETEKTPVGELADNCWLKYKDGSYAPAVGITAAQKAECDVALYLDPGASNKYCEAGAFDAAYFFEHYAWGTKLYNANGNEVRVLRPWETTETKYSVFIGRRDKIYLIDNVKGASGLVMKGISADGGYVDGVNVHKDYPLAPTGINPDPVTTVGNKARCFFFDYSVGDSNTVGANDGANALNWFYGGTFPRSSDMQQYNNAVWARANNYASSNAYPIAEGGFHALNAFITCMEVRYKTKYLHNASLFGTGVSSNHSCSSESTWRNNGGFRYKASNSDTWSYCTFTSTPAIRKTASTSVGSATDFLNGQRAKWRCCEAQVALSLAALLGIAPGEEFECYGGRYWYETPQGIEGLEDGLMNARLYRIYEAENVPLWNNSGVATNFDIGVILEAPICLGKSLCGDIYEYTGGGCELVQTINTTASTGQLMEIYLQPDQKQWVAPFSTVEVNTVETKFGFEDKYLMIGTGQYLGNGWSSKRLSYGPWKLVTGGSESTGECAYSYENKLSSAANHKVRAGCRFRGYAYYATCCARNLAASYVASHTYAYYGGSAHVLLKTQ